MDEGGLLPRELIEVIASLCDLPSLFQFCRASKRCQKAAFKSFLDRKRAFKQAALNNELQWEDVASKPGAPRFRSCPGSVVHPQNPYQFFIFGGQDYDCQQFFNDLCLYDIRDHSWTAVLIYGQKPPPRGMARMHSIKLEGRWHLIVFAGQFREHNYPSTGGEWTFYNDIWVLDLEPKYGKESSYRWRQLHYKSSEIIEGRVGQRTCILDGKLWTFGGCFVYNGEYTHFNDVWTFDFDQQTWQQTTNGTGFAPRHSCALAALTSESFAVCAGSEVQRRIYYLPKEVKSYTDVQIYNIHSRKWVQAPAFVPETDDWYHMEARALSPKHLMMITMSPHVCDLETGDITHLPKAHSNVRQRLIVNGFDFVVMWWRNGIRLLKCEDNHWLDA